MQIYWPACCKRWRCIYNFFSLLFLFGWKQFFYFTFAFNHLLYILKENFKLIFDINILCITWHKPKLNCFCMNRCLSIPLSIYFFSAIIKCCIYLVFLFILSCFHWWYFDRSYILYMIISFMMWILSAKPIFENFINLFFKPTDRLVYRMIYRQRLFVFSSHAVDHWLHFWL